MFFRQSLSPKDSAILKWQLSTKFWYMILYDSHFQGKENPAVYHLGDNRTIILISPILLISPIRSKLSLVPPLLLLCISNPGFGRGLWEKLVGKILCHTSRASVVPGPWLVSWRYFQAMASRVLQSALPDVFAMLPVDAAIIGSSLTSSKEYSVFPTGEQPSAVFPHIWNSKEQCFQAAVEDELRGDLEWMAAPHEAGS